MGGRVFGVLERDAKSNPIPQRQSEAPHGTTDPWRIGYLTHALKDYPCQGLRAHSEVIHSLTWPSKAFALHTLIPLYHRIQAPFSTYIGLFSFAVLHCQSWPALCVQWDWQSWLGGGPAGKYRSWQVSRALESVFMND